MRFAACGSDLGNLNAIANWGCCEFHFYSSYQSGNVRKDVCDQIHAAGMSACIQPFDSGEGGPDKPAGPLTSYFQNIKNAGWDGIAAEGVTGDTVGSAMNFLPYCNYGGIVDIGSEVQFDMYTSPWNHPKSGGQGHVDYIETYDNHYNIIADSCAQQIKNARSYGSKSLGILIGNWMHKDANTYIDIINKAGGVDTIMIWGGTAEIWSAVQEATGLKNHYGVTKSKYAGGAASSGTGTTSGSTSGSSSSSTTATQKPVRLENPDTPAYRNYEGYNYVYTGMCGYKAIIPKMKWEVWIAKGVGGNTEYAWQDKLVFSSTDSSKAALSELTGTIDRSLTTNTFELTLLQNPIPRPDGLTDNFRYTDHIKKNQRVKIWIGYDDTPFTADNYVFGGYVSNFDRLNTFDGTLKVTIAAWERVLTFQKYYVTENYEWIELGYLMKRLWERKAARLGHFEYANTGVIVDRYVAKDKRLSDCVDEILSALEGFDGGSIPPTTYTPDEKTDEGMGQLYSPIGGRKRGTLWDFWMDEAGNAWLLPLFKKAESLHSYKFKYGKNLISFERQMKDEFDAEGRDVYTVEVPFTPELNTYNDNIIEVSMVPQTEWESIKLRIDGIAYDLSGTMKLTCTKIASTTPNMIIACSKTTCEKSDSVNFTALATYEGKPITDGMITIYYTFDGKRVDCITKAVNISGKVYFSKPSWDNEGDYYFKAVFLPNDEFVATNSNQVHIHVKSAAAATSNSSTNPNTCPCSTCGSS